VKEEATMTTIKLFTRTLVPALGLLLALTSCGEGDKGGKKADKGDKQAKVDGDKTKDTGKEGADAAEPEEPEAEVPALDPKVEKAVTLANALSAEPGRTDAILEEAGMDRASFQTLLYEIAHDPELSKSYAIAREA
jgi:hypothetical protein